MPEGHERVMTADGQTLGAEILNWASQISRHQPGNQHEFPQDVARAVCNMLVRQAEKFTEILRLITEYLFAYFIRPPPGRENTYVSFNLEGPVTQHLLRT